MYPRHLSRTGGVALVSLPFFTPSASCYPVLLLQSPPRHVTECEIRSGSPLWEERRELGIELAFPWRPFDLVLPPFDECSELVPSVSRMAARTPSAGGEDWRILR